MTNNNYEEYERIDPGNQMPGFGWMVALIASAALICWLIAY